MEPAPVIIPDERTIDLLAGGNLMKIKVYHNGDDTFIAWNPEKIIPGAADLR